VCMCVSWLNDKRMELHGWVSGLPHPQKERLPTTTPVGRIYLENFRLADLYAAVTCLVLNSRLLSIGSIAILRWAIPAVAGLSLILLCICYVYL